MDMDLFSLAQLEELDKNQEKEEEDYSSIIEELVDFDLSSTTPLQAMIFLQKLKDEI